MACRKSFDSTYPESLRIYNIINMLISVQSFSMELRAPNLSLTNSNGESNGADFSGKEADASDIHLLKNLEVVLVIDELRVISFDRYGMKLPSSVAFDDQVRSNLSFLRHFLMKQVMLS